LPEGLSGEVLRPGDGGYEEARRVHNGLVDKRPTLIVRCRAVPEVVGAVDFRRCEGLEIAIRGGGHNVAGVSVCDASNRSRAIALSNSDSKPHRRRTNRRVDARWTPRLVLVAPADNERS